MLSVASCDSSLLLMACDSHHLSGALDPHSSLEGIHSYHKLGSEGGTRSYVLEKKELKVDPLHTLCFPLPIFVGL